MKTNFSIYIDAAMFHLIPSSLQLAFRKLVIRSEFIDDILISSSYYLFVIKRRSLSTRKEILKVARLLLLQANYYFKHDEEYMKYSACNRLALDLLDSLV